MLPKYTILHYLSNFRLPKVMLTDLFELFRVNAVFHMAETKRTKFYEANYNVMTNALKTGFVMTKTSSKASMGTKTSSMCILLYLP